MVFITVREKIPRSLRIYVDITHFDHSNNCIIIQSCHKFLIQRLIYSRKKVQKIAKISIRLKVPSTWRIEERIWAYGAKLSYLAEYSPRSAPFRMHSVKISCALKTEIYNVEQFLARRVCFVEKYGQPIIGQEDILDECGIFFNEILLSLLEQKKETETNTDIFVDSQVHSSKCFHHDTKTKI